MVEKEIKLKDGKKLIQAIISGIDDEFDSFDVERIGFELYGIKPKNVGTYLTKMAKEGEIDRLRWKKVKLESGRTCDMCIWKKTSKWMITPDQEIRKEIDICESWSKVWPEFFKQHPLPTGKVYKLEM